MAYSFTTPESSVNINLDKDLLADAEEGSISFWEQDLALWTSCVANLKAYNEKKRLREEAEDRRLITVAFIFICLKITPPEFLTRKNVYNGRKFMQCQRRT